MTDDSGLRAGDMDRDRVVAVLGEAFAQGRLTEDEYHQRLDAAHRAVTFGDLETLTTDLPGGTNAAAPSAPAPAAAAPVPVAPATAAAPATGWQGDRRRKGLAAGWASWAGVSLLMVFIWFASGLSGRDGPGYFWPIWVIGPWGIAMVVASFTGGGDDDR